MLAHGTGHRINAIRQLKWAEIDIDDETVRWRAEQEKSGYEHVTPRTAEAVAALELARQWHPGSSAAPLLTAPRDPSKCPSSGRVTVSGTRAEVLAGLDPKPGHSWHSLMR